MGYVAISIMGLVLYTAFVPILYFLILEYGRVHNLFRGSRYMSRYGWLYRRRVLAPPLVLPFPAVLLSHPEMNLLVCLIERTKSHAISLDCIPRVPLRLPALPFTVTAVQCHHSTLCQQQPLNSSAALFPRG